MSTIEKSIEVNVPVRTAGWIESHSERTSFDTVRSCLVSHHS